jgi:hypothetical protein
MLQFWNRLRPSLRPNFGPDGHGRDLQVTFELLGNVIRFLVAITAIWAVAAGFLQAALLIQYIPKGLPGPGTGYWALQTDWLGPLLAVPIYALKAFAVAMLLALAAAMVGGLLGFLFGVPRPATGTAAPSTSLAGGEVPALAGQASAQPAEVGPGGAAPPAALASGVATPRSGRTWQSSTNLTEISDWLTKIIVGIGLVEAKWISERFTQLSQSLGAMLFDGAAGSRLVIPSVIIVGALVGFLYAYLFTQLVIAGLVARTDAELSDAGTLSVYQAIVPRAIQSRKENFSDYIQGLVSANDGDTLDRIAQALYVAVTPELQAKRRAILAAVGKKVDLVDAAEAAKAMDRVSALLQTITKRTF